MGIQSNTVKAFQSTAGTTTEAPACEAPIIPQFGRTNCVEGNELGSVCYFTCMDGFYLQGNTSTSCDSNLLWNASSPTCSRITCNPVHTDPINGRVSCLNGNSAGNQCVFTCNDNLRLVGESISTCIDDDGDEFGVWSSEAPTCVPKRCDPPLLSIPNGRVRCTNWNNFGSICRVLSCRRGYFAETRRIMCMPNNKWSSRFPSCVPGSCNPHLVEPMNGRMVCSNNNLAGSRCVFSCTPHHRLVGSRMSSCVNSGVNNMGIWTNPAPTCERSTCVNLNAPRFGTINCSFLGRFQQCSFTCLPGYLLDGKTRITCGSNLFWVSAPPICLKIDCQPAFEELENGDVSCSNENHLGSQCTFQCNAGFILNGTTTTYCDAAIVEGVNVGMWRLSAPTCSVTTSLVYDFVFSTGNQCIQVGNLQNGDVGCTDGNSVGTNCSFTCNTLGGYSLTSGNVTSSVCLEDRNWDMEKPCCARTCPPIALLDMVILIDSSSSVGRGNWNIMKSFVRTIINSFQRSATSTQISVLRYNRVVDSRTQILLNEYLTDQEGFLAAYDRIPYNGGGTLTGKALRYVNDVILTGANGDRPGIRDVLITVTDGRAHDNVLTPSRMLRAKGVEVINVLFLILYGLGPATYVIGIQSRFGALRESQLLEISGSRDRMFILTSGFASLSRSFANMLMVRACGNFTTEYFKQVDCPITCDPRVLQPANGAVSCTDRNSAGSVCVYTCDSGYQVQGEPRISCNEVSGSGEWSAVPPTCEVVCKNP
ncbi:P-selectin-like [Ciona intestinalis]